MTADEQNNPPAPPDAESRTLPPVPTSRSSPPFEPTGAVRSGGLVPPQESGHVAPDALARALADAALLHGTFTLRSGRTSTFYLDKYLFLTDPALLQPVAQRLAQRIRALEAELGQRVDRLAGTELGGVPLVAAVSLASGLPCLFVRGRKKEYGTERQVEGNLQAGDRVVLIEDVVTTGGAVLDALAVLRRAGARVLAVLAVVDRQEGGRERCQQVGVRFDALFSRADLGLPENARDQNHPAT